MASTEDDLPEELDKLQITPNVVQFGSIENELPLVCNPFFGGEREITISETEGVSNTPLSTSAKCIAQRRRALRVRRASEGTVDERNTSQNDNEMCSRTPSCGGVVKYSLKKSISSSAGATGQRRLVLREPILKALQTCFRQHSSARQSIATPPTEPQSFNLSNQSCGKTAALSRKGINDFRDLISECHSLLKEDVEFSGQLSKLSLSMRISKNFTTMQTSHNSPKHAATKLRCNKAYQAKQEIPSHQTDSEAVDDCVNQNPKSSVNVARNSLSASSSPEHAGTSARYSTSCSQQAGNSAAAGCDDVNIDELASYFDTFVHIPKKMSSMAEMIYEDTQRLCRIDFNAPCTNIKFSSLVN